MAKKLSYTKDSLVFTDSHLPPAQTTIPTPPEPPLFSAATLYWRLAHAPIATSHIFSHLSLQQPFKKENEVHFRWGKQLLLRPPFWDEGFYHDPFFLKKKGRTDLTSQASVRALRHFVILLAYWFFRGID